MEVVTNDKGVTYTNHAFVSPIESENIQKNVCATCHQDTDMVEKVHTLQAAITARETEVGNKLSDLKDQLAEAVASGNYSEDQLNELRQLYRAAQWYFDFDYVENSEGAHNSKLANYCLDTSEQYIQQASDLF
jgi:nitrite reductase (cytochrome c-552)